VDRGCRYIAILGLHSVPRRRQNCGSVWNAEQFAKNRTIEPHRFCETLSQSGAIGKINRALASPMVAYYVHDLTPLIFRLWYMSSRWYGLAYVLAFACSYALFRLLAGRGYADLPCVKGWRFHYRRRAFCGDRQAAGLFTFLFYQSGDVCALADVDSAGVGRLNVKPGGNALSPRNFTLPHMPHDPVVKISTQLGAPRAWAGRTQEHLRRGQCRGRLLHPRAASPRWGLGSASQPWRPFPIATDLSWPICPRE